MTAREIIESLALRHTNDVFVPECKDGPTWNSRHLRLDAWAMAKSWSNPRMVGYEVKVSRSDFLADNKWHGYLPLCHELFFVCPHGLIKPEEMPTGVGLLWHSKTGQRFTIKRKADHREIELPGLLLAYVVMCRAKIVDDARDDPDGYKRRYWDNWLAKKVEDRHLDYQIKGAIRESWERVRRENTKLRDENNQLSAAKAILERLGVKLGAWNLEDDLKQALSTVPKDLDNALLRIERDIQTARHEIEAMKKRTGARTLGHEHEIHGAEVNP